MKCWVQFSKIAILIDLKNTALNDKKKSNENYNDVILILS